MWLGRYRAYSTGGDDTCAKIMTWSSLAVVQRPHGRRVRRPARCSYRPLVEKHRIGGDCTWTGCVPSKTLLKAAKVAHEMRTAGLHGLSPVEPIVDLKKVMARVRAVVADVYQHESPDTLRADGIDVFLGGARFLDPHTIAAGETTLTARRVLLATGAHPFIPPVDGLDKVDYLTYENVWDLEALPRHMIVAGGGTHRS